jgi:hypothetical protein
MEDRIAELAMKCFDGDPDKAIALLELLKLSLQPECSMPDVKMLLPEEVCYWEKEGNCYKDIPDSIGPCKKPCTFFKNRIE